MKSIIEDFGHIAMRLKELQREKTAEVVTQVTIKPEECKPVDHIIWDAVYGFTPGVEDDLFACWLL